jgi:hypothetical protein
MGHSRLSQQLKENGLVPIEDQEWYQNHRICGERRAPVILRARVFF